MEMETHAASGLRVYLLLAGSRDSRDPQQSAMRWEFYFKTQTKKQVSSLLFLSVSYCMVDLTIIIGCLTSICVSE